MRAELRDVRLADQDRTGLPQPGDHRRVRRRASRPAADATPRTPGSPVVAIASLTVNGTPESGPGRGAAASARARSRSSTTIAFSSGFRASIRLDVRVEHLECAYLHVKPPSTGSAIPVTYRAAGEASHKTASLTSRTSSASRPGKTVEAPQSRATSWKYAWPIPIR